MNNHRHVTRLVGSLAAVAAGVLSTPAMAQCKAGDVRLDHILNRVANSDTMVLAHRGYWGKYDHKGRNSPENSTGAVAAANASCADGVELDVKTSRDGELIVMHDFNLGRTTTVYAKDNHQKYDPFTNHGHNPPVDSWNVADIERLHLLSPDRSHPTTYTVPTVWKLLQAWKQDMYVPLIFDVKTTDAVRKLDTMARTTIPQPERFFAMKVNATMYHDPAAYHHDAYRVPAIPVYTTNMLGKMNVGASVQAWSRVARTMEINIKQHNGLMYPLKQLAHSAYGLRVGVFQAIPDAPTGHGNFFMNTGQCCYRLHDLYYTFVQNGETLGKDTEDHRGDLNFIVAENFGLITSDDPDTALRFLTARGKRQTHTHFMY